MKMKTLLLLLLTTAPIQAGTTLHYFERFPVSDLYEQPCRIESYGCTVQVSIDRSRPVHRSNLSVTFDQGAQVVVREVEAERGSSQIALLIAAFSGYLIGIIAATFTLRN